MTEPFWMHTYELTLAGGALLTVEARGMVAAMACAKKEWRRDIGGTMPDVLLATVAGKRRVIVGDSSARLIEAKVPA